MTTKQTFTLQTTLRVLEKHGIGDLKDEADWECSKLEPYRELARRAHKAEYPFMMVLGVGPKPDKSIALKAGVWVLKLIILGGLVYFLGYQVGWYHGWIGR